MMGRRRAVAKGQTAVAKGQTKLQASFILNDKTTKHYILLNLFNLKQDKIGSGTSLNRQ
jgi:hypothetical protein